MLVKLDKNCPKSFESMALEIFEKNYLFAQILNSFQFFCGYLKKYFKIIFMFSLAPIILKFRNFVLPRCVELKTVITNSKGQETSIQKIFSNRIKKR